MKGRKNLLDEDDSPLKRWHRLLIVKKSDAIVRDEKKLLKVDTFNSAIKKMI